MHVRAAACLVLLLSTFAAPVGASPASGSDRLAAWFARHPELRGRPGSGWNPYQRAIWLFDSRTAPPGGDPAAARRAAWSERGRRRARVTGGTWFTTGSTGRAGRCTDLAFDPTDANVVYVATAGGGVWKTTDAGTTWAPLTDDLPSTAIGAVAVLPWAPNTVLAGTGEGTLPGFADASSPFGVGLVRSTDAGATWNATTLTASLANVNGFHVITANATSHVILAGTVHGLWRSTDDGAAWSEVDSGNDVFDVKWKPDDPNTVYASKGVNPFLPAGADEGVRISTDGGLTFVPAGTGQPSGGIGKTKLAVSAASPDVVYAHYVDINTFGTLGIYRSTDAGATWSVRSTTNIGGAQGWYDLVAVADPDDADVLITGGQVLHRSTDGGATYAAISGGPGEGSLTRPHADNHRGRYEPGNPNALWVCTDGGPYRTTDNGMTWLRMSEGMITFEFYDVCVAQTDNNRMLGGTQDNGTPRRGNGGSWSDSSLPGDGMICNVDPLDPEIAYGERQLGIHSKSTNHGVSWTQAMNGITGTGFWITAVAQDPADGSHLYTTSNAGIFRTTDGAAGWVNVAAHAARWISISAVDGRVVWTVTSGSGVRITTDDGATWVSSGSFPVNGWESRIQADPIDAGAAFVTFGGYATNLPHVLRTTDFGGTWQDATGDFPDVPANVFVVDPDRPGDWYLGSDAGVWLGTNGGANWVPAGTALPNAVVTDLEIQRTRRKLVAATFGRGVWEMDLPANATDAPGVALPAARLMFDAPYPNPVADRVTLRFANRGDVAADLDLVDVAGRRLSVLERGVRGDGVVRSMPWYTTDLAAGTYFLVLRSGEERVSRKITIAR
jgi:hypothetical protein